MRTPNNSKLILKKLYVFILSVLGIVAAIIIFAFLLMLPVSTKNSLGAMPLNALYTSISAFTLCGSSFAEGSSYWSAFGLTVIALCIQVGALTIMAFSVSLFLKFGQLIKIKFFKFEEYILSANNASFKCILKYVIIYMLAFEILGTLLYSFVFIPTYGVKTGVFYSAFTSLSVFSNCGMKVLPSGASEIFNSNILYNFITFALSFSGGIGFIPLADIITNKSLTNTEFGTKVSFWGLMALSVLSGILFLITEHIGQNYLNNLPIYHQAAATFKMTQTVRCSQIGTFDFANISFAGKALATLLMFIGSAQYSFSGGLHISTVFTFLIFIISCAKGNDDYELMDMSFERKTVKKSIFLISVFIMSIFTLSFILTIVLNINFFTAFFETVSAFTLSGITIDRSVLLSNSGKVILMISMLCGRFGFLYLSCNFDQTKVKTNPEVIKIKKPTNLTV